jgi:hypothetical protein
VKRFSVTLCKDSRRRPPVGKRRQRAVLLSSGAAFALLTFLNVGRTPSSVAAEQTESVSAVPTCAESIDEPQRAPDQAGKDADVRTARRQLRLGESTVDIVTSTSERPGSKHFFCNLHDDENTAVEAGLIVLGRRGGRLVELQHGGKRDIRFRLDGDTFSVDPNRIFTTEGVRRTLAKLSRHTTDAEHTVERFGKELLSIFSIEQTDAVIALHNNSEGAYSALSYKKGGNFASDAAAVFIKDGGDPDDFFFVTETAVFDALRRHGFNVVLQDNRRVTDDGSLSVYCGRLGVRYINVEAQHGHLAQQVAMILALQDVLHELGRARPG